MGDTNSSESKIEQLESKFQKLKSYNDQRYGDLTIYRNHFDQNQLIFIKSKWSNPNIPQNQKEIEGKLLKMVLNRKNDYIAKLLLYEFEEIKEFCASYQKNWEVYDFPHKTLKKEFDRLRETRKNFQGKIKVKKYKGIFDFFR